MTTATRLLLVLCLPLLALAPPACRAAENLVQNPGFEETDAGKNLPAQWEPVYWSNPHGNVASSPQSRSGKWSVQLAGIPKERITDGEKRNNTLLVQDLGQAVTGLRKLTLRVFFKTEGDGRAYLSMTTADKDGRKLQYESTGRRENQADWGTIAWHFTTDSRTASLKIYLRNEGAGAVWYDDVSLAGADEVLENALARIVIEPLVGGRIRSFVWKATNEEKTVWHGVRPGGMAADLLPAGETPGFLRDTPYRLQVLDPAKRLLLRHEPSGPQWAGLVIEKEISLAADSAGVDVRLRVKNTADEPRTFALRAQQCLPPSPGTFTWPGRSGLGAWQPPAGPRRAAVSVQDLKEGWLACSGTDTESGTVALFDLARVGKARVYHSPEFSALEWTYEPVALAAGAVWETSYTVAALPQDFPVVMASREMALGLRPLGLGQAQDYALTLFSLRGQQSADVGISANAGKVKAAGTLKATVADPALLNLPGRGQRIGSIEVWVRAGSVKQSLSLSAKTLNDKPREEQPAPADLMDAFPAASGFFPYGEYLRGYVGSEMGSMQDLVVRSLRACRRNYLNTYMVYEGASLGPFKKDGACWISELLRQFDMRLIPRADMMRRFDAAGKESAPPDEATSAEAVARIAATGFDLPLRKAFAEKYGDVLLAYDYSDEPGPEYIPLYMHLQSVLRTADPAHPSLTILNLNQTAFLPYMPIYYGDEYPIRNRRQGGRNPWSMAQSVRGCAESTRAPVWVMLPAFGGYEEYTWHLPTGPEMRLMIYLAVANGAKGVTFHGSFSPPCWRYNQYYTHTAIDSWGAASDAWQAMGEAGRQVTAIGPSLLRTEVSAAGPFAVECAQITAGSGAATYKGPAATLGVLKEKDRDGCFLVLVNQDITNPQTATLSRSAKVLPENAVLFDLHDLAPLGPARSARPSMTLAPGDARFFYCGPREAGEAVCAAIHGKHYQNERAIYSIDAEVAARNALAMPASSAAAKEAATAFGRRAFAEAHGKIAAARKALAAETAADAPFAAALEHLRKAGDLLTEVAHAYRDNFDVVVPPDTRKGISRGVVWSNKGDAALQRYADETAACFLGRLKMEDRVYKGEARAVQSEAAQLLETARRLHAEAIPYVRQRAR